MSKVEIMAFLNAFHNITYYLPYLRLGKRRFLLHVPLVKIACQICFAEFHKDTVFVEFGVDFVPPVVDSNDILGVGHAACGDDIEFTPIHSPLQKTDKFQGIYLEVSLIVQSTHCFILKLRLVFHLLSAL